jgi:hypothetical protein
MAVRLSTLPTDLYFPETLPFFCFWYSFRPPLWSSGQSSWLQIQRPVFDSRRYQIFWEVVGLEGGPLSLVSTIGELLGRKSIRSGLVSRELGRRVASRWLRDTLCPQSRTLQPLILSWGPPSVTVHCLNLRELQFCYVSCLLGLIFSSWQISHFGHYLLLIIPWTMKQAINSEEYKIHSHKAFNILIDIWDRGQEHTQ